MCWGTVPIVTGLFYAWLLRMFSNYWIRLSRIWRVLQIKEGVIYLGVQPRWIKPSKIWAILYILRKLNSIKALLFIQDMFPFSNEFRYFTRCFLLTKNSWFSWSTVHLAAACTFDVMGSILQTVWRHRFDMTKLSPNLVNSGWLCWIMCVALTYQKRGNILNE